MSRAQWLVTLAVLSWVPVAAVWLVLA